MVSLDKYMSKEFSSRVEVRQEQYLKINHYLKNIMESMAKRLQMF